MKKMEVSAKAPKAPGSPSATILVDYPETVEEAKAWCGDEALLSNGFANWRVTLQAGIRRGLETGKTQEQIQTEFNGAKMGVAVTGARLDPLQAALAAFKGMDKEKRAKFLADLKQATQ